MKNKENNKCDVTLRPLSNVILFTHKEKYDIVFIIYTDRKEAKQRNKIK